MREEDLCVLRTVTQYAFDDEISADNFINSIRNELGEDLTKYSKERREKKSKGQVVAERYLVIVQADYGKIFDGVDAGGLE